MKIKIALTLFVATCFYGISVAQTAEILFINNNSGTSTSGLDVEVRVMPEDTVYSLTSNIDYLNASGKITVPSSTILKLNYLVSGTSNVFYSQSNVVLNANAFDITFLYGTASSKSYSKFSGSNGASAGNKVEIDFAHTTPGLQEIDLYLREPDVLFADNFTYGNKTFTFDNEFDAMNYTLDITPFDERNGLFAYVFPAASFGGQYIYLFTAGTATDTDMYMVEMDGTVTKLATTQVASVRDADLSNLMIKLFPNPASDLVTIDVPDSDVKCTVYNMLGEVVQTSENKTIDVKSLANASYCVKIETESKTAYTRLAVSK